MNPRLQARLLRAHIAAATPGGIPPRRRSPLLLLAAGLVLGVAIGFLTFGGIQ